MVLLNISYNIDGESQTVLYSSIDAETAITAGKIIAIMVEKPTSPDHMVVLCGKIPESMKAKILACLEVLLPNGNRVLLPLDSDKTASDEWAM